MVPCEEDGVVDDPLFPEYDAFYRWLSLRPSLGQSRKGAIGHIGEVGRGFIWVYKELCETSRSSCVGVESSVRFDMISTVESTHEAELL